MDKSGVIFVLDTWGISYFRFIDESEYYIFAL
jgi:hypothetical protein